MGGKRKLSSNTARVVGAVIGLLILGILVPTAISLSNGDGDVCVSSAACPLSAINPCVRQPSFALIGRCALAIR